MNARTAAVVALILCCFTALEGGRKALDMARAVRSAAGSVATFGSTGAKKGFKALGSKLKSLK